MQGEDGKRHGVCAAHWKEEEEKVEAEAAEEAEGAARKDFPFKAEQNGRRGRRRDKKRERKKGGQGGREQEGAEVKKEKKQKDVIVPIETPRRSHGRWPDGGALVPGRSSYATPRLGVEAEACYLFFSLSLHGARRGKNIIVTPLPTMILTSGPH